MAFEKLNILMVDDQPSKLLSYEAILAELGENLIKANSGREALEQLLRLGLIVRGISAGRGRATTLWTRPQNPDTNATPCEAGPYGA